MTCQHQFSYVVNIGAVFGLVIIQTRQVRALGSASSLSELAHQEK